MSEKVYIPGFVLEETREEKQKRIEKKIRDGYVFFLFMKGRVLIWKKRKKKFIF